MLHRQASAREDLLQCLLDARTLGHHRRAVGGAHVVQVDADREARQVEDEEVERGATRERDARGEKRVGAEPFERLYQRVDLLPGLERVPAAAR